jgi:hypothetical protein
VSTFLVSTRTHPALQATPTTVSYDVSGVSEAEPKPSQDRSIHRNFGTPFSATERNIHVLRTWSDGWDGYEAPSPNRDSIEHALWWAKELYRDVRDVLWIEPLITADEEGDVVFEWWRGHKKLTVYISPDTAEYVKVERQETDTKMEDGSIETARKRREMWNWLRS